MTNQPPQHPDDSTPGEAPSTGPDTSGTSGLPSYGSSLPPAGESPAPPPPPPPPPPPAPEGAAGTFSPTDAIGWGWRKFTENAVPILIAAVVLFAATILIGAIGGVLTGQSGFGMAGGFSLGGLLVSIVQNLVSIVISAVIARGALDVVDGRGFDLASAFGRINFVNVIIAALIVSVIVSIGFLLLFVPGIVALFLTYFTTYFVVDDDAESPVKAIGDSVKLIGGRVGESLLLALLNILVLIAGTIALLVGLLVAYPVVVLASAYAYRTFRGQPVAA